MTTGHLVEECERAIAAALDKVDAVEFLYLPPADKAAGLVELQRLETRIAATRLRMLARSLDRRWLALGRRTPPARCRRRRPM